MYKRRRLNDHDVDHDLADIFENLASEREETRIRAAERLLSKYAPTNQPGEGELLNALKRLFRGLCSGRKAARLGYSVALTEFLSLHVVQDSAERSESALHVSNVVRTLSEQTPLSGGYGQDERNYLFGRVFGAEAVIKSRVLFSATDVASWEHVLSLLFEVMKKKAWLSEECGWLLYDSLETLKDVPSGVAYAQALINALRENDFLKTPEGLALWTATQERFPDIKFPKHVYHHRDPLNPKERRTIAAILREAGSSSDDKANGEVSDKGNWTPRLHIAWEVVLTAASHSNAEQVKFSELWREAVDEGLFAASSSRQRRYWGFLLFQRYIRLAPAIEVAELFTPNLLRCLVNQLASKDRYLHALAERCRGAVLSRAKKDTHVVFPTLKTLIQTHNHIQFDQITKTKTIDKLLSYADNSTQEKVVTFLRDVLAEPRTRDHAEATQIRQTAADFLVAIVRMQAFSGALADALLLSRQLIDTVLQTLSTCAYFEHDLPSSAKSGTPISKRSHEMFKARLMSCLTYLVDKDPSPHYHPSRLALALAAKEARQQQGDRDGLQRSMSKALEMLRATQVSESGADAGQEIAQAFNVFVSITMIQIYNGEEDAAGMLEDLQRTFQDLGSRPSSSNRELAVGALMDMILGMVSRPSLLFRRLAQLVFPTIADSLDEKSIASMVRVIQAQENAAGQAELFDQTNEQDEIDAMNIEASNVEEIDVDDVEIRSEGSRDDDGTSDASDSEHSVPDADDDQEAAAFDAKLAQALGTHRADEDLNAESDSSPDEDMNDEQMQQLDAQISAIFRERKKLPNRKKENKDAQTTVTLFKCRVIELLEILVKRVPRSPVGLHLILPVLALIKSSSSKDAKDKACSLFREHLKAFKLDVKGGHSDPAILSSAQELLPKVHELAMQEGSTAYRSACSQASLLLVKFMLANGGHLQDAWQQYAETGTHFVTDPKCSVKNQFFTDWLNWCVSARQAYEKVAKSP